MGMNSFTPVSTQAPATANTAATVTLAAPTDGSHWTIDLIEWSYSGTPVSTNTPTVGSLTISWTVSGTTYNKILYITTSGPGWTLGPKNEPFNFPSNTAVTIALAAGGSGVYGSVYPNAWTKNG